MSYGKRSCTVRDDPAYWQLHVVDPDPPVLHEMGICGFAAADIDGDGNVELLAGGEGALLWYRPATHERGVIAEGRYHVGLALEDVDGDGKLEVVTSELVPLGRVLWYKPPEDLRDEWAMHVVDPGVRGCHDLVFADLDNDGRNELVAAAVVAGTVDIYKPGADETQPWQRHTVMASSKLREGTDVADVNGDGQVEIMCGPSLFTCAGDDPFRDAWSETPITQDFRNMCRAEFVDITGSGRPDVLMCESEYHEGRLCWFENRILEDPAHPWLEHGIDQGLTFAHSMQVLPGTGNGETRVFITEMAEGGWSAPRNWDARIMTYETGDRGASWQCTVHSRGQGTHQAFLMDIDGDGEVEVVGKEWRRAQVQIFKRLPDQPAFTRFRHHYIDLDKPYAGVEILPCDVAGNGGNDIVCGAWWYRSSDWKRFGIPGIEQVVAVADVDGDGSIDLVCLDEADDAAASPYQRLTERLVWLKAVDPEAGKWDKYPIGTGMGDWPHGSLVAPVLPGGKLALVIAHHGAWREDQYPELFEVPDDPTVGPWPKRTVADIRYSEQVAGGDLMGSGRTDLALGQYLLENLGDGTFRTHSLVEGFQAAQTSVADVSGNGRPDIVLGEQTEEKMHGQAAPVGKLIWLENGADWDPHVIDHQLRWPHSLSVADLDGDGENEIVVGEHDPSRPYRSRCRLLVYKKANSAGTAWYRHVLDDRFEHHCGTKAFEIEPGRWAIASHGWVDSLFVHLWVQE